MNEFPNIHKEAKIVSSLRENLPNANLKNSEVENFASLGNAQRSEVKNFASLDNENLKPDSRFLDHNEEIQRSRAHLPHWHQNGKFQFVTFRLADSLPQDKINELKRIRENLQSEFPSQEAIEIYYKKYGEKIDQWLDAGMGSCILALPENRRIVEDALKHFDGDRYLLHAFVVMPNHVHVLLEMLDENKIGEILHSWKRWTARKINEKIGTAGTLWQHESFDRMIRGEEHYARVVKYIIKNSPCLAVVCRNLTSKEAKIVSSPNENLPNKGNLNSEVKNFASLGNAQCSEVKNFASLQHN